MIPSLVRWPRLGSADQTLPLSQQKEFRAIKNLVIQEAENLHRNVFTFEDADMVEEYTDVLPENSNYDAVLDYYQAVETLDADDVTQAESSLFQAA